MVFHAGTSMTGQIRRRCLAWSDAWLFIRCVEKVQYVAVFETLMWLLFRGQERGRRELLRSKQKFQEVGSKRFVVGFFRSFGDRIPAGFQWLHAGRHRWQETRLPPLYGLSRCPVSFRFARNSLPRILEAVDHFFHLNGALKAGFEGVLHAMLDFQQCTAFAGQQDGSGGGSQGFRVFQIWLPLTQALENTNWWSSSTQRVVLQGPARATHRRGSLGGNEIVQANMKTCGATCGAPHCFQGVS